MFDKQAINEYRSVTAPSSLKARVIQAAAKRYTPLPMRRIYAGAAAAAACIVLVITGAVLLSQAHPPVTVSTDGVLIADTPQAMTANVLQPRLQTTAFALLTLEADGKISVESEDDGIYVLSDTSEELPLSDPYTANSSVTLKWRVTNPTARFTANGHLFELRADDQTSTVTVIEIMHD